jgi:hypothetical protein
LGDARIPIAEDGATVSFNRRGRTAVLHWDVKRVVMLLALLALVAIAATGGELSWSDGACGIFW